MVVQFLHKAIARFIRYQAAGGILLLIMALFAIIIANSGFHDVYHHFLEMPFVVTLGHFHLGHNIEFFINDGLMVIFFLLVSLEIKREVLEGQLSSRDQQIIPVIGALGGVVLPAAIFAIFNWNYNVGDQAAINGWAIPAATDIAFAIGVISLFGSRVPISLKLFLTALAIIDDLAAILIIALFYNNNLSIDALLFAIIIVSLLIYMNYAGVTKLLPYFVLGFCLWIAVLESGIHATIAGVLLGLTIPLRGEGKDTHSPLKTLEHSLEPWSAFFILPIFAFANAGVSLAGLDFGDAVTNPISLGIIAGLFIGKQLGVFTTVFLLVKSGIAKMPKGANWKQIYGVSILTGIGFTMSIFIGNLAYIDSAEFLNIARIGILCGSFISAICGYIILHYTCAKEE